MYLGLHVFSCTVYLSLMMVLRVHQSRYCGVSICAVTPFDDVLSADGLRLMVAAEMRFLRALDGDGH